VALVLGSIGFSSAHNIRFGFNWVQLSSHHISFGFKWVQLGSAWLTTLVLGSIGFSSAHVALVLGSNGVRLRVAREMKLLH